MAALTDFSIIKSLLDLSKENLSDYPGLSEIMDSVDAAIANYLQRGLTREPRSETAHIGDSSRMVPLKGLPVASVSSVMLTTENESARLLAADEYQASGYGIRMIAVVANAQIDVTYTGGPESPSGSWARAAEIQVRHEWQTRDHIAAERVSNDGGSVTRPGLVLLDEVIRLLNPDRHPLLTVMW